MKRKLTTLVLLSLVALGAGADASADAGPQPFVVDFTKTVGVVRRLNGLCNATPLAGAEGKGLDELVAELEIPSYRFHDASMENPGIELVDVSRVFPLFHADADDPRNYDFRATDDYLAQVVATGAEIEFRLGESIEHTKNHYFVNAPPDFAKWAEICVHIIRHYNEGWANGFRWNIRRWSIWEEPDTNPALLAGSDRPMEDVYPPLYKAAATRIKREFPDLLVGGPQCCHEESFRPFVAYCAKERLPLDFCGFTCYARDPEKVAGLVRRLRRLLDAHGFDRTGVTLAEWHFGPIDWGGFGSVTSPRFAAAMADELTGPLSAAYTAALLLHMQDEPIERMYYYAMKCGSWGLFDANARPTGPYWAMRAFARVARGDARVAAPLRPRPGWWVLASRETKTGVGRILVATMRTDDPSPQLTLKGGVEPVSVRRIDRIHDFETTDEWEWHAKDERLFLHRNLGDSAVWLVEARAGLARAEDGRLLEAARMVGASSRRLGHVPDD